MTEVINELVQSGEECSVVFSGLPSRKSQRYACTFVAGRGTLSRARNWALVHSEMNCLRRHMCWQSKRFYWEGCPGGEQEGEGTQENCSARWLEVLGFMEMGLVSGLFLANHSDSESFLVVHALFSQDGCQKEGFWEVVGNMWCLLLTFPELFQLVEAY